VIYSAGRLKSKTTEIKKAVGVYEASLKTVEDVMKEAVEIVKNDPGGNRDLLTTLSTVKHVFDGDVRPGDKRVADQELAVMSISNVIECRADSLHERTAQGANPRREWDQGSDCQNCRGQRAARRATE
jgi:hypothetical protein